MKLLTLPATADIRPYRPWVVLPEKAKPYCRWSTSHQETHPPLSLKHARRWEVFFGRDPECDTDDLLSDFLETEIIARFPRGSTYTGATGWRTRILEDGTTKIVKEGTAVVFLVEVEGDDSGKTAKFRSLVAEVASAYKKRFGQDAVLVCEVKCLMGIILGRNGGG